MDVLQRVASGEWPKVKDSRIGALLGPALVIAFIVLLYLLVVPKWQTNDDVMMAMVAHGYGFIADADPRLLFSSVIWGHIAQAVPSFFDVQGYSWLTVLTLALAAISYAWVLERRTASLLIALLFVVAVFMRPFTLPQFTTVSGLITGSGILLLLYSKTERRPVLLLALAVLFISMGFWIRWRECVLMLIVFAPLIIDMALLRRRAVQIALVALIASLGVSAYVDDAAYDTPEWRKFEAANAARVPYTDHRLAVRLADQPELLEKFGYTTNDLNLISWFFFVDQAQLDPQRLNALTDSVPAASDLDFKFRGGVEGLVALSNPAVVGMVIAIFGLLLFRFNWRLAASTGLFLAIIFALGFMGRPGAIRVYYPVLVLLLAGGIAFPGPSFPLLQRVQHKFRSDFSPAKLGALALGGLLVFNAAFLYKPAAENAQFDELVRRDLDYFQSELIYIWGAAIPFDRFFPLWTSPDLPKNLYALGVSSFAPYAVPFQAVGTSDDMYYRLENGLDIAFVGYVYLEDNLDTFCNDRFGTRLTASERYVSDAMQVKTINCR